MTRWEYMNCCYGVAEHPRVYTEASGATVFLNGLTGVSKGLRSGLLAVPRPLGAKRQPLSFIPWIRITGFGPIGHPLSKNLRQFQNPFPKERHHLVPQFADSWARQRRRPLPPSLCSLQGNDFFPSHSSASARLGAVEVHHGGLQQMEWRLQGKKTPRE